MREKDDFGMERRRIEQEEGILCINQVVSQDENEDDHLTVSLIPETMKKETDYIFTSDHDDDDDDLVVERGVYKRDSDCEGEKMKGRYMNIMQIHDT